MSTLTFSTLQANSGGVVKVPYGQVFDIQGNIKVPNWTTGTRPSGETGKFGYNTSVSSLEVYDGSSWKTVGVILRDGSSADAAALNGQTLKRDYPSLSNGLYWIKNENMPAALEMYVDMTEDGGGYDFYAINNGNGPAYITDSFTGSSTGLQLWEGRSPNCWLAASKAVAFFDNANFGSYWQGVGHVFKSTGGGNYTGCIMRSQHYGGSNCGEWRVKSGMRWWIRNNTHSEPNGDYNANGFLRIYGSQIGNPFNTGTNMGFNDGGAYGIGSRYLLSTNAKL
jgi:hypothetical protein